MKKKELDWKLRLDVGYVVSSVKTWIPHILPHPSVDEVYVYVDKTGNAGVLAGIIPEYRVPDNQIFHLGYKDFIEYKRRTDEKVRESIETELTEYEEEDLKRFSKENKMSIEESFSMVFKHMYRNIKASEYEKMKNEIIDKLIDVVVEYYDGLDNGGGPGER